MDWASHAQRLAEQVTHPGSRWREPVTSTPRHLLVPCWWAPGPGGRTVQDGPADPSAWMRAAYSDRTLVTQIGILHADHATPEDHPCGYPTSSSTLPSLVLTMFGHANVHPGLDVLDVGTGSGYGAGLLAHLLGSERVTSMDVDPYLVKVAGERLAAVGLYPTLATVDATGPLPGEYDRVVATMSVKPIPASWLEALRPGGRLVTTIAGTSLIVVADKTEDGGAAGQVARDWAMFMSSREGADYPPRLDDLVATAQNAEGDSVEPSRFPVLDMVNGDTWEIRSMLEIAAPGIEHSYGEDEDSRTAVMVHEDGSWARAESTGGDPPTVHQGGPRRLWDELDHVRDYWLQHGALPLYGARVRVSPDGAIRLQRGRWTATIA
ncbi:protein-L-isoaspartate O-methyltransferase [Acrocarpospora phusangensis]|uniref:Protein-L-isoaspartate O-methyltransferase n=1 Tax=Acrocarpospora phusangensis TaxID=1070424 RepID=A0A919Q827_9ACTN|nr:methyltransferase domain-containing protein [Acrocarpospora phusangensis]GIH23921.1 protein-L-isoaspartate O-methyltransferase [Acrocarpospora phusangensis]